MLGAGYLKVGGIYFEEGISIQETRTNPKLLARSELIKH